MRFPVRRFAAVVASVLMMGAFTHAGAQSSGPVSPPVKQATPAAPVAAPQPVPALQAPVRHGPDQSATAAGQPAAGPPTQEPSAKSAEPIRFREDAAVERSLGRLGWVLLGLGVLTLVVLHMRGRIGSRRAAVSPRRLQLIEMLRLSPRNALYLVEMDRSTLLLAMNGAEMKLLVAPAVGVVPPVLSAEEEVR